MSQCLNADNPTKSDSSATGLELAVFNPEHHKTKKPSIYRRLFADWTGLEPATSAVTGRHSNQLNYQSVPLGECKDRNFSNLTNTFDEISLNNS